MNHTCANSWCKQPFEITDGDLEFYDKVSPVFGATKCPIPPPTLCPECRRQRRLAWRNERVLYPHSCDRCKKSTITAYSPDCPFPVYCNPCWRSEEWDAISYAQEIDPAASFIDQYMKLYERVPQRAMLNDDGTTSENCAYCWDVSYSKNCYLVFGTWKLQDSMYSRICDQSKFCVDCEDAKLGTELAYECVDSQKLYRCVFLQNSENSNDCLFGFDLKGCSDCVGCFGLRQKRHCIWNEQLPEDEYRKRIAEMRLDTFSGLETMKGRYAEWIKQFPRKAMNLQNCENCLGDHLFNCRDVVGYVTTNSEHSRYVERCDAPIYTYDVVQSGGPQWCLECLTVDEGYLALFCEWCNQSKNIMYSDNCLSCKDCFGCVSLRRKQYCIFNRQYTKEEYERLMPILIETMRKDGQWGEFFPMARSPFGYNETNAQEFFPQTRDEVLKSGWKWRDTLPYTTGKETLPSSQIPNAIADVSASICDAILACDRCRKNYKVIQQEFDFYQKMSVPVPHKCPDCRNIERLARRNPLKLWQRTCAKCGDAMHTTYAPDRPEKVYCERCYLETVY